ncbi:MAG TPA: sigma-70 family RNA polymerase sigma factor [Caulobacteraceae bacterium]|nr:sigma-70 family RNA polymerase sigma factor [Caulobacteraceae bacterium]
MTAPGAIKRLSDLTRGLQRTLRLKGASSEDAEDVVQEALLKYELFRRAQAVRDPEAFIRRTAFNLSIDVARRRRRSPVGADTLEGFDQGDPAPSPYDILASRDSLKRLQAGLAAMKPKTRNILLAHRLDGLTYAQIAQQEGLSPSAVEKHLARAMLFLQTWMKEW